jgi:sensory rhodopsin
MYEVAQVKGIRGESLVQALYLTAIVMVTGFLAARDVSAARWIYFAISSVAYVLLLVQVLSTESAGSRWIDNYVIFGWSAFPVVFLLAPTGIGLIGAGLANLAYLLLDIYTKIIFNLQAGRVS